jgi:hypothetical protein
VFRKLRINLGLHTRTPPTPLIIRQLTTLRGKISRSTLFPVGLSLVQQANDADSFGCTVLVHATGLPPIRLRGPMLSSSCGAVAFVPGERMGDEAFSTWAIPLSNIVGIEVGGDWTPEPPRSLDDTSAVDRRPQAA